MDLLLPTKNGAIDMRRERSSQHLVLSLSHLLLNSCAHREKLLNTSRLLNLTLLGPAL